MTRDLTPFLGHLGRCGCFVENWVANHLGYLPTLFEVYVFAQEFDGLFLFSTYPSYIRWLLKNIATGTMRCQPFVGV